MGNPNQADKLDQSPVSENQAKRVDVYFGIFFDGFETNALKRYRAQAEKMKEEYISDVTDSSYYMIGNAIIDMVKDINEALPDNPVSNAINEIIAVKESIESKAFEYLDTATALMDDNFGLGDVSNSNFNEGEEVLGSDRSIVSKLEPCYRGDITGDLFETKYNHRIYAEGAVTTDVLKNKPPKEGEEPWSPDEGFINFSVQNVVNTVKDKINAAPQNLCLHFDIFGYVKDPAVNKFLPEINQFSQNPKVSELVLEHQGIYTNYHSCSEVFGSLGGTRVRFNDNINKIEDK